MLILIQWLDDHKRSLSWLAGKVDRSRQAVSAWDEIPPLLVPKIARITGIPANKFRPDIFVE